MNAPAFLLLLAVLPPIPIEKALRVKPADFQGLHVSVKNRPATLDLQFEMEKGGTGIRLMLIPQSEESRFRAGRTPLEVASTDFATEGRLKTYIATPGEYLVIVDNRVEAKQPAVVILRGTLTFDTEPKPARVLGRQRRVVTIGSSLCLFFGVVWLAGRRLWDAQAIFRRN